MAAHVGGDQVGEADALPSPPAILAAIVGSLNNQARGPGTERCRDRPQHIERRVRPLGLTAEVDIVAPCC